MKNKLKFIGIFALVLTAVGVYAATNDLCIAGLILATGGVGVTGTVTTESIEAAASEMGADIIRDDWSSELAKIYPNDAAFDTMLRNIGTTTTKSVVVKMASIDVLKGAMEVQTTAAQNTAGTPISIILTAATYKEALIHRTLEYEDATLAKKVNLYIVAKDNTNKIITCVVYNGTGTGDQVGSAGIASGTKLYGFGIAKYETDAQTDPYAKLPEIEENYCQIHMCQVEQSIYSQMQEKELQYGLTDFRENALYNFRMDLNKTALIGKKAIIEDPIDTNRTIYLSGGFEYFNKTKVLYVPGETEANGGMSINLWNRIGAKIFATNGSPDRILFCEAQLMVELLRVVEFQKMMDAAKTEIVYGVKCSKIETGFGAVNVVLDYSLTNAGRIGEGCLIDVKKARLKVFDKMHWSELILDKTGQSKTNAWRLEERSCCEFFNVKTGCWFYPSASNITDPDNQIIDL